MNEFEQPVMYQDEVNDSVWNICAMFRGDMEPDHYVIYVLNILFLKIFSDSVNEGAERSNCRLPEGCDFYSLYQLRDFQNLGELLDQAFWKIEDANRADLEGALHVVSFGDDELLGEAGGDRDDRLKQLLEGIHDLHLPRNGKHDVLGDCYDYLISRIAFEAHKRREFSTPPEVAELVAKLVGIKPGDRICDPACGAGSLLIKVANEMSDPGGNPAIDFSLFGQEVNAVAFALCRMNMFLHGINDARIELGDVLRSPKFVEGDRLNEFDVVVATPPFGLKEWSREYTDDRFGRFDPDIRPNLMGDYAFILHMIETAKTGSGRVGVVVPLGLLFRGSVEGILRRKLIEDNLLDAIIGLPADLFYGTHIPAAILLFDKGRSHTDVLIIDARGEGSNRAKQDKLRPDDVSRIIETHRDFTTIEKYSYRATRKEIEENDYDLNIGRYVAKFDEADTCDRAVVEDKIIKLEAQLEEVRREIGQYLAELGS